jgi:cytidylate kinase
LREDRDDHDDLHDAEALAVARDAELVDTANRSPDPVHHVLFGLAWPEGRDR